VSVLDLLKDILQTLKTHLFSYSKVFSLRNPEETLIFVAKINGKTVSFWLSVQGIKKRLFSFT
jgi:hypothetical protein